MGTALVTSHQSSELTELLQSQLRARAEEMKEEGFCYGGAFFLKQNNIDLLTIYQEDV